MTQNNAQMLMFSLSLSLSVSLMRARIKMHRYFFFGSFFSEPPEPVTRAVLHPSELVGAPQTLNEWLSKRLKNLT